MIGDFIFLETYVSTSAVAAGAAGAAAVVVVVIIIVFLSMKAYDIIVKDMVIVTLPQIWLFVE